MIVLTNLIVTYALPHGLQLRVGAKEKLFHDIDDGLLGEDAKTGSLYLALKEVKDNNPKPSE